MAKIQLPNATSNYDYPWTLKSTTAERGEVLIAIGQTWTGDGRDPEGYESSWVEAIAGEQVVDILTAIRENCGNAGLLRVLTSAMSSLGEFSDNYREPTAADEAEPIKG